MFVNRRVRWPQEFVLAGTKKERVNYDNLTMGQWMVGFCKAIQEESCQAQKDHMLDYLVTLLEDANDFSWQAAKASHAVLLCRMEQGEINDYSQVDKIDRIRRAHAQRHIATVPPAVVNKKPQGRVVICQYFNSGHCNHQNSHENRNVTYKHACLACFKRTSKYFPHAEVDCRNRQSKNE